MPEDRLIEYLGRIDGGGWTPEGDAHAPGFDEWNALRLSQGQRMGTFTEYMRDIAPLLAQERRMNCD
jgi:hypothetical protein